MHLFSPTLTVPSNACRFKSERARRATLLVVLGSALVSGPVIAQGQLSSGRLTSRADLTAAAEQAELAASRASDASAAKNAVLAASLRQRLRDGDFQVGDRVAVTILSDSLHRDTLVVRAGRVLELPGNITLPLTGLLRSELEMVVTTEYLKYVKARQIEVTPLMRIGVLGEVSRPGYLALSSDIPLTDVIMAAGGPTATADLQRSIIRRGSQTYRSGSETRNAIAQGLTLDQFGLEAGDELVIGRRREMLSGGLVTAVGLVASLVGILVAVTR